MPSERVQRQIDRMLDEIERAADALNWDQVRERAEGVLALDPQNKDALDFVDAARRGLNAATTAPGRDGVRGDARADAAVEPSDRATIASMRFSDGRYEVRQLIGEGGRKRVYLAHDSLLDRDVAFALIKTEGLDDVGRARIQREAQAMGRLGDHPNIVPVFDLGEDGNQPYIVSQYMAGGDVESLLREAGSALSLQRTLEIAVGVCRGLAFAHSHQIVHRDLKPRNVWLAADGTPKIGDFGIALSLDRTRLTQQGQVLPIGTVNYMPPEQAIGGAVTPRSDLYAFGAMLYELVTGRPPFVSDDPWVVISQHLETEPVSPAWHTDACPPVLETLILRLLAKAQDERPESATEVLRLLESIDPGDRSVHPAGVNPLTRLARGVFVGREHELDRLRDAFDRASEGSGGVVMVVGAPGIGKTRTVQELETYASARGGRVLWGRCHESAGAPAYWPWVQAMRAYVAAADASAVRSQLGGAAPDVARIVPGVRAVYAPLAEAIRTYVSTSEDGAAEPPIPDLPQAGPALTPRLAQTRLFEAVTAFLKNAAAATPLVLVLDDLHWADEPTLLLLQHMVRELAGSSLLLVGTYRDVELGRQHPLEQSLAALAEVDGLDVIDLRGLSEEEVADLFLDTSGTNPQRRVVRAIHRETEGNPFFVGEVVALMAQESTLDDPGHVRVPPSVRAVIGQRLNALSPACNDLLATAAVAGREFTHELLTLLVEDDDEHMTALLGEAEAGRIIEQAGRPGEYRFVHALMRETLSEELSTTRRVRLHGRVGEALVELRGEHVGDGAADIARHFVEAATLGREQTERAVRFSWLAAEQAETVLAWDEALRHYELAAAVIAESAHDLGTDAADLLTDMGRCQVLASDHAGAMRNLLRAVEVYRDHDDWSGVAHATVQAIRVPHPRDRLLALLSDALDLPGDHEPRLEAELLSRRAMTLGPTPQGEQDARAAAELAATHGVQEARANLALFDAQSQSTRGHLDRAAKSARSASSRYLVLGGHDDAMMAMNVAAQQFFIAGDFEPAESAARDLLQLARTLADEPSADAALYVMAKIARLRGDLERGVALTGEDPSRPLARGIVLTELAEPAGDAGRTIAVLPGPQAAGLVPDLRAEIYGTRARVLLHVDDTEGARRELEIWADVAGDLLRGTPTPSTLSAVGAVGPCLAELGDDSLVQLMYRGMARYPALRLTRFGSADEFRGALALRLELDGEAEQHFREGWTWADRQRCPVEMARCLVGLSEAVTRRRARAEAVQHMDRAIELFERHHAGLYLRHAVAKRQALNA